jgi:hypothetical protein
MKTTLILCAFFLFMSNGFMLKSPSQSCDIEMIYSSQSVAQGTLGISRMGETVEIQQLLVPMELNEGNYEVTVTRKAQNIYKIENKDIYVKTKHCYEYLNFKSVVLKITSKYGYTKGQLIIP